MNDAALRAASEVVIETLPLFEMARMRAATTARRHPVQGFAGDDPTSTMRWVNQFTHTRRLLGPADEEVVTPNNDTLYTNAWLDLSDGPVVIDVPEIGDRYWTLGFLDAWTNPWAYAGKRTTGGMAQRLFVHGPRWRGDAPPGAHVISAPGDDVWIIGRILVDDDATDLDAVQRLQGQFAIRRLDGADALSRVDAFLDGQRTGVPDVAEYVRILSTMMKRNPPARRSPHWPPSADVLPEALEQVYTELRADTERSSAGGGWHVATRVRTDFGEDYLNRARVARNWIGTLGIEEAMYIMAEVDGSGDVLDGSRRYVLRFPPGGEPQVDAFWSITLYRSADRLLVANPIGRYSIGDRTRGIRRDADGGLTLSIQADDPGPGANWLPAPRGEPFYLALRLYQPRLGHLEETYRYPAVIRVD
jgi:acetate---CoA ligase (ADP-forming)